MNRSNSIPKGKIMNRLKPYIKIARPDHWIKQLFILPGLVIADYLCDVGISWKLIGMCLLGLLATSLIASANYVINEWLDAEFDKYHPTKKNRPVVNTDMSVGWVYFEYFLLAILGLAGSLLINIQFFFTNVLLLVMGFLYNVKPFRTKDIPIVDVLSESVNNVIRFMLGWFVVTNEYLPPVSIAFGFWMCGAFLMDIKRFAEYRMIADKETALLYRKSFKWYNEERLLTLGVFYAMLSMFNMGTFFIKYQVELILVIPVMCAIFCYYLKLAFKEDSAVQKPEKLYREPNLLLLCLAFVILFLVLMYAHIPSLQLLESTDLIEMR